MKNFLNAPRNWLLTTIFLLLAIQVQAQMQDTQSKMDVAALTSTNAMHPGSTSWVALELDIAESWHINANKPSEPSLIGTEMEFKESTFEIGEIQYPEPDVQNFSFTSSPIPIYHGTVYIFARISAPVDIAIGKYELNATFEAQACDDSTCLMPSKIPVMFEIEVVDSQTPVNKINQKIFEEVES